MIIYLAICNVAIRPILYIAMILLCAFGIDCDKIILFMSMITGSSLILHDKQLAIASYNGQCMLYK